MGETCASLLAKHLPLETAPWLSSVLFKEVKLEAIGLGLRVQGDRKWNAFLVVVFLPEQAPCLV